jgi:SAM-dependent methyltransferase
MTTSSYAYDQDWQDERKRLAGMEGLWDPGTRAVIESLGIAPGWRCLEVGAGGGSIAEWLAERVGPDGRVLATDVSTRYLDPLEGPNLEVRRHDILSDPLPEEKFDLVHARLVVEHLGFAALERMAAAVRPAGWILLEDFDWAGAAAYPEDESFPRVTEAVLNFMSRSGYDAYSGRKLVHELERAGLEEVGADGRVRVYRGGTPATGFTRLSLESLKDALLEAGDLTQEDLERAREGMNDPATVFVSAAMIAAWGRKPG